MAILKKKENETAGAATGGAAQTGGQSAAGATAQPTDQTAPAATTTLSGGTGAFGDSGGTTSGGESGGGREQTKAGYTGGQRYFNANQEGAKKLANQITNPLNEQAKTIQEQARQKALEGIANAGESTFNKDYLDLAGEDARQLNDEQRGSVEDTLGGVYNGPQDYFNEEARQQNRQLGQDVDQLGTVAGTSQALSDAAGLNDRKYSAGMRNFDAALLRQDPTLRENIKGMGSLAGDNTTAMDEQRQNVLDAIGSGRDLAAERKFAAEQQFQDIQQGQTDQWGNDLEQLRGNTKGINENLAGERAMSQKQLDIMGLTAEEYDSLRDSYIATSYGLDRPLRPSGAGYGKYGETEVPVGETEANYWRTNQLDQFQLGQDQLDNIGYRNVVGGDDFARYDALNQLRGVQNQEGLGSNFGETPESLAQFYNKEAMNSARDAFEASGAYKPRTQEEYRLGTGFQSWSPNGPSFEGTYTGAQQGEYVQQADGSYQIEYPDVADGILDRNPLTGQLSGRYEYTGPQTYDSAGKYIPTNVERADRQNYQWDTSIDQNLLDNRAIRSGFADEAAPEYKEQMAYDSAATPFGFGVTAPDPITDARRTGNTGDTSWERNNKYGDDIQFGEQKWRATK